MTITFWIFRNSRLLNPELAARATGLSQNFASFSSRWTWTCTGSSCSLLKK
jgi:hypothetical protein